MRMNSVPTKGDWSTPNALGGRETSRDGRGQVCVGLLPMTSSRPAAGIDFIVEVASSPKLPMAQAAPSDAPSKHLGLRLEVHHRSVRRSGSAASTALTRAAAALASESGAMAPSRLIMSVQDGVLTLSLNRPEKLNAIDNDLSRDLLSALTTASSDPSVRVVVVNGNGRAFCAGRDISAAPTDEDLVLVQAVSKAIVDLTKPVIAAVHGWTVGAGLEWMLNADVVIASSSARFKLPEASIGVFVTGGLTATLAAYAGLARAKALMLLGEEFSPTQALAWGLVWRVVAPDELASGSRRMAEQIASLRPEVVSQYKRVLNAVGMPNFHRAIELESEAQRAIAGQKVSPG